MCQGFFDWDQEQEIREWKRIRSLGWNIVCGYADPTKLPQNQVEWWPMSGDVLPKAKRLTKARKLTIAQRIKQELGG